MTNAEIDAKLRQLQIEMVAVNHMTQGLRRLFDSASWSGDGVAAAGHRESLHTMLDAELDHHASLMLLSRKKLEIGGS